MRLPILLLQVRWGITRKALLMASYQHCDSLWNQAVNKNVKVKEKKELFQIQKVRIHFGLKIWLTAPVSYFILAGDPSLVVIASFPPCGNVCKFLSVVWKFILVQMCIETFVYLKLVLVCNCIKCTVFLLLKLCWNVIL